MHNGEFVLFSINVDIYGIKGFDKKTFHGKYVVCWRFIRVIYAGMLLRPDLQQLYRPEQSEIFLLHGEDFYCHFGRVVRRVCQRRREDFVLPVDGSQKQWRLDAIQGSEMMKNARKTDVGWMTGIILLGSLLVAMCASGTQDPPLRNGFWVDSDFFQEWRDLVANLGAGKHLENAVMTAVPLTEQEFEYQRTMLRHVPEAFGHSFFLTPIFRITPQTLQRLQDAGLPQELLGQLQSLEDQQFTDQTAFVKMLEQHADPDSLKQYQATIVMYALTAQSLPTSMNSDAGWQTFSAHLSLESQENMAAWNALFAFPRTVKTTLVPPKPTPDATPPSYHAVDEEPHFNIRALLKRWGIPKPSTLILIGIGLYLVMALLSRR